MFDYDKNGKTEEMDGAKFIQTLVIILRFFYLFSSYLTGVSGIDF